MIRIALAGAQDTGKTTLARALAAYYSIHGRLTDYVSEYAREHLSLRGEITLQEQYIITVRQIAKEKAVPSRTELMFTDSPVFLSYVYSLLESKNDLVCQMTQEAVLQLVRGCLPYDLVFLLKASGKPREDGMRVRLETNETVAAMVEGYLDLYQIKHTTLTGSTDEKMPMAISATDAYLKAPQC